MSKDRSKRSATKRSHAHFGTRRYENHGLGVVQLGRDYAPVPSRRPYFALVQRNAPIEEIAAIGIAVAECEAKHVQSCLAVVDSNGCEGDWHTIIKPYPRDRYRMSDVIEGDRQDLR